MILVWRGGRVVECGGLENRCLARGREFESHPLRQIFERKSGLRSRSSILTVPSSLLCLPKTI